MPNTARTYTAEEEAAMRAAGLRPVTIWVPDLTNPVIFEEYSRQARLAAKADNTDHSAESFSEAALADLDLPPYEQG